MAFNLDKTSGYLSEASPPFAHTGCEVRSFVGSGWLVGSLLRLQTYMSQAFRETLLLNGPGGRAAGGKCNTMRLFYSKWTGLVNPDPLSELVLGHVRLTLVRHAQPASLYPGARPLWCGLFCQRRRRRVAHRQLTRNQLFDRLGWLITQLSDERLRGFTRQIEIRRAA